MSINFTISHGAIRIVCTAALADGHICIKNIRKVSKQKSKHRKMSNIKKKYDTINNHIICIYSFLNVSNLEKSNI